MKEITFMMYEDYIFHVLILIFNGLVLIAYFKFTFFPHLLIFFAHLESSPIY